MRTPSAAAVAAVVAIATLCLLNLGAAAAAAADAADAHWPRFRGPNGAGVAVGDPSGLPIAWDQSAVRWKTPLPGSGQSSPVLWGRKLFITSADPRAGQRFVLCLDADTGKELWRRGYDFAAFAKHSENSYAHATPAVDDLHVYVPWLSPERLELVALTHAGDEVWRANLGRFVSEHANGCSPVVHGETVVLAADQDGPDSAAFGFDRRTGRPRWKVKRGTGKSSSSTPAIYAPADGSPPQVILCSRADGVTALDLATGKLAWQVKDALPMRSVASPIVAGDVIIANCGDGPGPRARLLVAVRPGEARTPAKLLWKQAAGMPYVTTPIVVGDRLLTWSEQGVVTCLDVATGAVHWTTRVEGTVFASTVLAAGRLYTVTKRGEVIALDPATGKVLGRTPLGQATVATPAIVHGRIYLRTASMVLCVGGVASSQ